MMNKVKINQPVAVTALGFRKNLTIYPRRMEYQGRQYNFVDAGLRCLLNYGGRILEFFTLSDGQAYYYLRLDQKNNWTLLAISN